MFYQDISRVFLTITTLVRAFEILLETIIETVAGQYIRLTQYILYTVVIRTTIDQKRTRADYVNIQPSTSLFMLENVGFPQFFLQLHLGLKSIYIHY